MSRHAGARPWIRPGTDLARLSLLPMAMALGATACLDAPPEYHVSEPVPPVILVSGVVPPPRGVIRVEPGILEKHFTVPFRSEDAGEDLAAFFVLDPPPKAPSFQAVIDEVPVAADPRPFAEQTARQVDYTWNWGVRPADCVTVTLVLSHESNFVKAYQTQEASATAEVSWLFDFVDPVTGEGHPASACAPEGSP